MSDGVVEAAATLDSTWGDDGYVEVGGELSLRNYRMAAVEIGPDDKLVSVTTTRPVGAAYWVDEPQVRVERFLANGSRDPGFGASGVVEFEPVPNMRDTYVDDVELLPDGRVLLLISPRPDFGQSGPGEMLLMLAADGSVDTDFADAGYLIPDFSSWACQAIEPYLDEVEVSPTGTIVALAQRQNYYSCPRLGLAAQFDGDGDFVDAFGTDWRPLPDSGHYFAGLIDLDAQNRLLLHDFTTDVAIRLGADGNPDPGFTPVPVPEQTNTSSSVFVDDYTSAIVVTAQAWGVLENGQDAATIDFYLPDGTPDPARPQAANPIPTVFEWGGYHNLKFRPNGEMVALDHTNSYLLLSATGEPITDLRYDPSEPEESWLFDLDSTGRIYRFDEQLNGRDSVVTRVAGVGSVSEFPPECLADPVACFAPHVLFHPDEDFYPMDVNDFVNGSVLKWQGCRSSEMLVNANPTPESLRLHAAHSWDVADGFWDVVAVGLGGQFYCRPDDDSRLFAANEFTRLDKEQASNGALRAAGGAERLDLSQGFFLDWEDGRASGAIPQPNPAPLVGRFVDAPVYFEHSDDRITYWFFYGYDPKADWSWDDIDVIWDRYGIPHLGIDDINPIGIIDGATAHEGDWEHVTIDLDADGRPTHVNYAGHGCDEKRVPWADLEKTNGTHPRVYVAEGSHASYPDEIDLGETYCTDDDYPSGQADVTEFDPATSVEWRTWEGAGPRLLEAECWYGFGGAWGDHRHIGTLLEPLRGHAAGPVGPPYNSGIADGQTPLSTSECRPDWGWAGSPVQEAVLGAVYEWGDPVALGFEDGEPLTETVFWLNSLPTEVARSTVDADGSLQIAFEIPYGTPPGPHRLVGQAVGSGATFYAATFWVDAPVECLADGYPSADDIDGDLVVDSCDPSLDDGRDADYDSDGVNNETDNCPTVPNPNQDTAFDGRIVGSACDERLGINTTQLIVETDNNPPTINVTVDPPLNPAGWANTAVTVTADCGDTEGPIAMCSSPVTVEAEGADQIVPLRAVDAVANETIVDAVVSIDTTPPTVHITGIQEGEVVLVDTYEVPSCVATDTLSGLNGQCTMVIDETTANPGTAALRATASATDRAGNATTTSVEYVVVYDTEAPAVTTTTDTDPNTAGWFNQPVTYSFDCADPSGVAVCPSPVTVSTEGADQAITVLASDTLGNATEISYSGINIDRTAPVLTVDAPATVRPADSVTIECEATDELSGIADTNCQTVQFDATSLAAGANTYTFAATDRAGNTATTTITIQLHVDIDAIAELIALYLGDTPGAGGQLNSLTQQLTNGDIGSFTNHVWAQCCTPTKNKRFTHDQATILVGLAVTLP